MTVPIMPMGGGGLSLAWGEAKTTTTGGTVSLFPCQGEEDGTRIAGAAEVAARVWSPPGRPGAPVDIRKYDILPYIPSGENKGVLLPVANLGGGITIVSGNAVVASNVTELKLGSDEGGTDIFDLTAYTPVAGGTGVEFDFKNKGDIAHYGDDASVIEWKITSKGKANWGTERAKP